MNVDALIRSNTAFRDLADMLNAAGSYRPSCDVSQPVMRQIADAYDAAQEARGDDRRAYRYGDPKQRAWTDAPAKLSKGDGGRVWANQGKRDAYVIAVADGRALIEYEMPAGRTFLWDVPDTARFRDLANNIGVEHVRNVSASNPPKRWRDVIGQAVQA